MAKINNTLFSFLLLLSFSMLINGVYALEPRAHPIDLVSSFNEFFAGMTGYAFALSGDTSGLTAYWNLDEGTGLAAYDSSGSGNTGTIYGAIWTQGKTGNALQFDGSNDFVSVPNSAALRTATAITVIANVKTAHYSEQIASKYDIDSRREWRLFVDASGLVGVGMGASNCISFANTQASNHPVNNNVWHHVAFTWDKNSIDKKVKIYVDGAEVAYSTQYIKTDNMCSSTRDLWIGKYRAASSDPFDGTIDDVKIYNRSLSATEILADSQAAASDTISPAAVTDIGAASLTANSITLVWTAPGDDGAAGIASAYDLRYSAEQITDANWNSSAIIAGMPAPSLAGTRQSFTVTGLATETTYYFAIKTADEVPNWSSVSNSPRITTGAIDITPPSVTISSPAESQNFTTSAITVNGTASDNVAIRKIEVTVNNGTWQLASGTTSWSREITLASGSNTIYVIVTDTSGNSNITSVTAVYDQQQDKTPPALSNIITSFITFTGATISWNTDEASDTQIEYGTNASYGYSTALNTSLATSHSQILSGLENSTTYYYRVSSRDAAGNLATSGDNTFNTSAPAASASSFRFIAWADTEDAGGPGNAVLTGASIAANELNPAFTLYPGDLIKCTASASCWSVGFPAFKTALSGNGTNNIFDKTFATRGNHEDTADIPWRSGFEFAAVASTVGATNYVAQSEDMTYSFDYGNSHFVGIDMSGGGSSTMTSAQIAWLDADLTAAENRGLKHAFLFWHGPVYPVGKHCCSGASSALIAVFNKHSIIDAGFFGHEMVLTYTHMNSSRLPGLLPENEFEEFVVGNVGDGDNSATIQSGRVDYGSTAAYGFVMVDVSCNNFNVSLYRLSGTSASVDKVFSFPNNGSGCALPLTCTNGIMDENETGIDCGGSCHACPDISAPSAINDLMVLNKTSNSVLLKWTAPGDDGNISAASQYDIRYSAYSINASNWASATAVTGEPVPSVSGTPQAMTIAGLSPATTHYFAIKTADEVPNWSELSNNARATTDNASEPISKKPAAYWKFDEGTGLTAYDSSGSGYNAILKNGANWVPGKFGYAIKFDGINDYVDAANAFNLGTGNWTISFWINQSQSTGYRTAIAKGTFKGIGDILIYDINNDANQGYMVFRNDHNTGTEVITISASKLANTGFRFVAVTRAERTIRTYLDGAPYKTGTIQSNYNFANTHRWTFGAREDGKQAYLDGALDEIKIYKQALSAEEIMAEYNQ